MILSPFEHFVEKKGETVFRKLLLSTTFLMSKVLKYNFLVAIFKTRIQRMRTRIRRMRRTWQTRRIQRTRWIRRIQRIWRIWRIRILIRI